MAIMNGVPIIRNGNTDLIRIKSVFLFPINRFPTINLGVYLAAMGGD